MNEPPIRNAVVFHGVRPAGKVGHGLRSRSMARAKGGGIWLANVWARSWRGHERSGVASWALRPEGRKLKRTEQSETAKALGGPTPGWTESSSHGPPDRRDPP
jgi:hypothetical protein